MAIELFGTPTQERSTMSRIGAALGGFGAGVQGKGQAYLADLQTRKEDEEKKRLTAMVKDAKQTYDFLNRGDVNNAMSLIQDRVQMIGELGGDPSDTARIGSMLQSGRIAEAQNELRGFLRPFMPTEAIKASELTPTGQRVSFDPLSGQATAEDVSGFRAAPPKGPTVAIMQSEPDFETTIRRESVEAQMGDINEQLAESPRIISTANDIKQLVNLMGKANLNRAESSLVDKYGLTATNLLNLGPETEAAVSLVSRLAPQMRPTGSGATSDFEARLYINSLPAFLQSDNGRKLTELVFEEYANIEQEKLRARSNYNAGRLNYVDYLNKITDLNSRSLFENDAKRREVEAIVPNFFNEVQSKIQLRPINPAITPVG
tara:strand:- start:1267 stop:2391 length:1125 start_codon:yes stop_codon:yes gene_type:complete